MGKSIAVDHCGTSERSALIRGPALAWIEPSGEMVKSLSFFARAGGSDLVGDPFGPDTAIRSEPLTNGFFAISLNHQ